MAWNSRCSVSAGSQGSTAGRRSFSGSAPRAAPKMYAEALRLLAEFVQLVGVAMSSVIEAARNSTG
jgi:hypothetical protein